MQSKAKYSLLTLVIVAGLVAAFFVFRGGNDSPRRLSRDEIDYRTKKAYETMPRLCVQEVDIRDLIYLVYRPSIVTKLGKGLSNPYTYVYSASGVFKPLLKNPHVQEMKTLWTNQTTVASYVDLSKAKISYNNSIGSAVGTITVTVGEPKVDPKYLQCPYGSVGLHPLSPAKIGDIRSYHEDWYSTLMEKVKGHVTTNLWEMINDQTIFGDEARRAAICAIRSFYRKVLPEVEVQVNFEKDSFDIEGTKGGAL